jgi:hypothetical protein
LLSRLTLITVLATQLIAANIAQQAEEYFVKAAFLCNFARFVEWAPDAFRTPEEPLAICVLGQDPFGAAMDDVVAGKSVQGRRFHVRRLSDARQTGRCQILFVSSSESKRSVSVLAAATPRGVLTVGEAGTATAEGMVITFTLSGGKVRFEINMAAAEGAGLRLSSKLLSLATVVRKR